MGCEGPALHPPNSVWQVTRARDVYFYSCGFISPVLGIPIATGQSCDLVCIAHNGSGRCEFWLPDTSGGRKMTASNPVLIEASDVGANAVRPVSRLSLRLSERKLLLAV